MHTTNFRRSTLATAITATLLTAGCGGGGSDSSSQLSGVVADGYLVGATVCLDMNGNKICDSGEPQAMTTAGGVYTLENVSDTNHPIVVEVSPTTVDEDTGEAVGKPYILTAPRGKPEFVSPLTTMVQTQLESNPAMSVNDAENVVKANLGYTADSTVDLFTDYVSAQDDESNEDAQEYERLHKIAQVAAQVLENNFEQIADAAMEAGLDPEVVMDSLVKILVKEVIDQLDEISSEVDEENFSVDEVASSTVGTIDTSTLADDVKDEELAANLVAINLRTILTGGVNWLEGERDDSTDDYEYGRIGLNEASTALTETVFEYNGVSFVPYEDDDDVEYVLGSNGWMDTMDDVSGWTVIPHGDNSATISPPNGAYSERVKASSLEVGGMPINAFLDDEDQQGFAQAIPDNAVFSEGATAYRWSFTQIGDLYELWTWTGDDNGGICYYDSENNPVYATTFNGNCNVVWGAYFNNPATSLAGALLPDGTDFNAASWMGIGEDLGVQLIGSFTQSSGSVRYLNIDAQNWQPTGVHSTGTWSKKTISGVEMIVFEVPAGVRDRLWDDDEKVSIYAVHDGFVRKGALTRDGQVEFEEEWTFNDLAMQDILSNFNPTP